MIESNDEMYGRILLPSTDGVIPSPDGRIHQWIETYTTVYLIKSVGLFETILWSVKASFSVLAWKSLRGIP